MDCRGLEGELTAGGTIDLDTINTLCVDAFTALLGGVFEHSSWVARAAWTARPFVSVPALHATMVSVVANSGVELQLALLRAHPELAQSGPLTAASSAEQTGIGLDRLGSDEAAAFDTLNTEYRTRYGFPFIIAVRGQRDRAAILAALSAQLAHSPEQEIAAALAEVAKIARFRLDDLIRPPAVETGRLTVHALDTALGRPAVGLTLSLFRIGNVVRTLLGVWHTNADGRCDNPLLAGDALLPGTYEVVFDVRTWRETAGAGEAGFYDLIPIRFCITDPSAHYHIPLLLSPYGYSTYRGS